MEEQAYYCVRTFIREYSEGKSNLDYRLMILSRKDDSESLEYVIGADVPNIGLFKALYVKENKRWYVDVFEKVASCAVDVVGKQWYDIEFTKVRRS